MRSERSVCIGVVGCLSGHLRWPWEERRVLAPARTAAGSGGEPHEWPPARLGLLGWGTAGWWGVPGHRAAPCRAGHRVGHPAGAVLCPVGGCEGLEQDELCPARHLPAQPGEGQVCSRRLQTLGLFFAAALCAPCWENQLRWESSSLGGFPRREAHAFGITGKERRLLAVSIKKKEKKLQLLPPPSLLLLPTRLRFRTKDSS